MLVALRAPTGSCGLGRETRFPVVIRPRPPRSFPASSTSTRVLEPVLRDEQPPAPAVVTGEFVAPADELVKAFAATLVARPQTERTNEQACKRFARWLGLLAGPGGPDAATYHAQLVAGGRSTATVKRTAPR